MTKLVVAFSNFANPPENANIITKFKKDYLKHLCVRKTGLSSFVYYFTSIIDITALRRSTVEESLRMLMEFWVP